MDSHFLQSRILVLCSLLLHAAALREARAVILEEGEDSQESSDRVGNESKLSSKSTGGDSKTKGIFLFNH